MVIHSITAPKTKAWYGEQTELDAYDIKELEYLGVIEAWYWYYKDHYDGAGYIIAKTEKDWICHDMSHYSCYGPVNGIGDKRFQSIKELKTYHSKDFLDDIAVLLEAIT